MIQCIRSSSWTGYMLVKVRHDLPEVGFVKIPRYDKGSVRMFVNVAAEHIVKFRQSQAGVRLWWNVSTGLAKSLARRPGAIVFSSRATKMYDCPARRATSPQVLKNS